MSHQILYFLDKYNRPFSFTWYAGMPHPEILLLSGGAMKGTYLLGALEGLKKMIDYKKFKTLVGISSGAIICFLLSIGFSPYCIYFSFLKNDNFLLLNLNSATSGIFKNDFIFSHIASLLKAKHISSTITFKEHFLLTKKQLVILAFNVTKKIQNTFSVKTSPDMYILDALKLSSSLPIIFEPSKYEENYYVDGGVWNNFPIDIAINHRTKFEWILAVTTLFSNYKKSNFTTDERLNTVMVNDDKIYLSLVCDDKDKFNMYTKGLECGLSICKLIKKKRRRNSY